MLDNGEGVKYTLSMEATHMVEIEQYREARKVLIGGTAVVVAHDAGSDDSRKWHRVVEVKAMHGAFLARFMSDPDKWTQIDGLEVRP